MSCVYLLWFSIFRIKSGSYSIEFLKIFEVEGSSLENIVVDFNKGCMKCLLSLPICLRCVTKKYKLQLPSIWRALCARLHAECLTCITSSPSHYLLIITLGEK